VVNSVLNSISKALYTEFGDTHHYYVEDVEQNSQLPCFTIDVLNPLSRSVNHKDYYRTVPIVIHYFTDNKTSTRKHSLGVGEQVLECLEYLEIDGHLVRAEGMSYHFVDDVLQVFLTYRFWTEKPDTTPPMEDMDVHSSSKVN
jgi:hypothetical protein